LSRLKSANEDLDFTVQRKLFACNQVHVCATVARQTGGWSSEKDRASIGHMKTRNTISRPNYRVRKFSAEILLATAITLAAIFVLVMSQEQTEMASAPLDDRATSASPQ
jgi:hypothetical protein